MNDQTSASRAGSPLVSKQTLLSRGAWNTTTKTLIFRGSVFTSTVDDRVEHFRFLDLPAELRNAIYEEVLVVGQVFFEKKFGYNGQYEKPQLALLRVCKQIHDEAEPMYLSKNLFHLPIGHNGYQPFESELAIIFGSSYYERRYLFSKAGLAIIRHIACEFHCDTIAQFDHKDSWDEYEDDNGPRSYYTLTPEQRRDHVFDWHIGLAGDSYNRQQEALCEFEGRLDYIHVDFSHTFCATGCCRPIVDCIFPYVIQHAPKMMDITGLRKGEKNELAYDGETRTYNLDDLQELCNLRILQSRRRLRWDAISKT